MNQEAIALIEKGLALLKEGSQPMHEEPDGDEEPTEEETRPVPGKAGRAAAYARQRKALRGLKEDK